ncbi:hypothetical protein FHS95_000041 [Sphingomonas naasensis]|uniref:Uncharacterized protein n=1 Tax=Sphingomonas naasensis TaxID=1344951 RepID=A0A4S1WQL1_9SPHN|nr:DUF6628 family protein [Sphingomonas naasensis]NIJ18372.1 hypothetical protein [Sphingomonas naasensis]TGX45641.1 hypothetical protein E5A74_00205 [Sphingomonas naasensis]
MSATKTLAAALPVLQPEDAGARLLLFGIRQMGAHGLHDACTAHAFVTAFGRGFQRPLVLLRALMAEMSAASAGPIQIAPWCCPRMTGPEATLLEVIGRIRSHPERARMLLADLLGVRDAASVACTAHALANAFADLALPLDEGLAG